MPVSFLSCFESNKVPTKFLAAIGARTSPDIPVRANSSRRAKLSDKAVRAPFSELRVGGCLSLHEPWLVWSPAFRWLERLGPAEAGTPSCHRFTVPMRAKYDVEALSLSMNLKTLGLIPKSLRISGSW